MLKKSDEYYTVTKLAISLNGSPTVGKMKVPSSEYEGIVKALINMEGYTVWTNSGVDSRIILYKYDSDIHVYYVFDFTSEWEEN